MDNNGDVSFLNWRGLFADALCKLCSELHPRLFLNADARDYVEHLIFGLLDSICNSQPHNAQDVEQHVQKTFPQPINQWSINEAYEALSQKGSKKSREKLHFSVQKVQACLRDRLSHKMKGDGQLALFVSVLLQYIAADILKLTGNYVKNIQHNEISRQDLKVAMRADSVLMELFYHDQEETAGPLLPEETMSKRVGSLNYHEAVKDLIHDVSQFVRDMDMVIRVFRQLFVDALIEPRDIDMVFSNVLDIHETSTRFIGLLEDTVEMCRDASDTAAGSCFLEMAEGNEFDVFEGYSYAHDALRSDCIAKLHELLTRKELIKVFQARGGSFLLAAKYVLPKLLLRPIELCLRFFEYLELLSQLSQSDEDREDLEQTKGLLIHLKNRLDLSDLMKKKQLSSFHMRSVFTCAHQSVIGKLNELQKCVEGWDASMCSCNEFVMEGFLNTCQLPKTSPLLVGADTLRAKGGSSARRVTERYGFLFDSVLLLCKPTSKKGNASGGPAEYKFKEQILLRKWDIKDNPEENRKMLNDIVEFIMLERMLNACLADDEKKNPLILPTPEQYRFAERDSEENIIFEDYTSSSGMPVVKGATLVKLVERLTYHTYVDPKFLRTFLTTYRSFCSPADLFSLLKERFEIPDPLPLLVGDWGTVSTSGEPGSPRLPTDMPPAARESLKRFRKEYAQQVQFRVLNVVRQWVERHWYDFHLDNGDLAERLQSFLREIRLHSMQKWVNAILKIMERKMEGIEEQPEPTFGTDFPPFEYHLALQAEAYDLMTLHPIEIARQVTLLEFDLYRAVKPIELVGAAWTKKDKDKRSPQLLKLIRHSTKFTYWLEKCIVEAGNIDERVAVLNRILEIMCVFQELNNFTGQLEIHGVLQSSPVHRLQFTFERADQRLLRSYERLKQLILGDPHLQRYHELLRSINPPCVPFFGRYLSSITFLEEGNPVFLQIAQPEPVPDDLPTNTADGLAAGRPPLISFSKCRKIADIIGEIQMYQNQPYCLRIEPSIRQFFENLNPLVDISDIETYLYERSCEIEPKNCDRPPNFPPSREYSLKSPGIKARSVGTLKPKYLPATPLVLTPLPDYGHHARSDANSPGAAVKDHCVMGIVDIKPGEPPRYVKDVSSSNSSVAAQRFFPPDDRSPPRQRPANAAVPPVPPRPIRFPVLSTAPQTADMVAKPRDKSYSPASSPARFSAAATTFDFPTAPLAALRQRSGAGSPTLSPLGDLPPLIPPRRSAQSLLEHSATLSRIGLTPVNVSVPNGNTVTQEAVHMLPCSGLMNEREKCATSPPPLPPRHRDVLSPPPLPPKRGVVRSEALHLMPPPLPPKTYKK